MNKNIKFIIEQQYNQFIGDDIISDDIPVTEIPTDYIHKVTPTTKEELR